jgi:hypothetical protein
MVFQDNLSTFFPHYTLEMEMKMVKFSGNNNFIGFLDIRNVGVEPKIVSIMFTS